MPVFYKIDAIDLDMYQLNLTCYNDNCPDGIATTIDFSGFGGRYPEGAELDRMVAERIPHDMADRLRKKQQNGGAVREHPSLRANPHFVSSFGAMAHITEGDEKIFQLRPLNCIRRFRIPVGLY